MFPRRRVLGEVNGNVRLDALWGQRKRSLEAAKAGRENTPEPMDVEMESPRKKGRSSEEKEKIPLPSKLGLLGNLPPEMRWHFYGCIPVPELARLSLASKGLMEDIQAWLCSSAGKERMASNLLGRRTPVPELQPWTLPSIGAPRCHRVMDMKKSLTANEWGLLIKALTSLHDVPCRMEWLDNLLSPVMRKTTSSSESNFLWGHFLKSLMVGWTSPEWSMLFKRFSDELAFLLTREKDGYKAAVLNFLEHPAKHQMALWVFRVAVRGLLLEPYMAETAQFPITPEGTYWLTQILDLGPVDEEISAKLLFVLYGPLKMRRQRDFPCLDEDTLCHRPIHFFNEAKRVLGPLAWAIESLTRHGAKRGWTEQKIFSIVEELTTHPEPWALDNFSALLLMAPQCAARVLALRVSHNSPDEAALVLNAAKTLAYRWNMRDRYCGILQDLVGILTVPSHRRRILDELLAAAHERLVELHQFPLAGNYRVDLNEEISAQELFTPHLFSLLRLHH